MFICNLDFRERTDVALHVAVICACVTVALVGLTILIPILTTNNKGKNSYILTNMVKITSLLLSQV